MNVKQALAFVLVVALAFVVTPVAGVASQADRVDAYVRGQMSTLRIPGLALAVVRNGTLALARGYGMANLELSVPATPESVFHLASITKTFTAIATMMLVEEGKVALDDPISRHLPDLPTAWHAITIRQLLSHTSGITSFSEKGPCPVGKAEEDYERADVLKEVACLPLEFAPGERWAYGDTGYHLLGMLIEHITGQSYEPFLRARIFEPLEMRSTRLDRRADLIPRRADGYHKRDGQFRNAPPLAAFEFASAGLVSTVLDMAKFDAALGSNALLRPSTLEQMWSHARLNSGEAVTAYGLGFGLTPFRGHRRVGHSGGGGYGFATTFGRFLDDNVTVIILSNTDQNAFVMSDMANEIASYYFSPP